MDLNLELFMELYLMYIKVLRSIKEHFSSKIRSKSYVSLE